VDSPWKSGALIVEEFGLGGQRRGGGFAACDANDAEDAQFGECGARDENSRDVAVKIGRSDLHAGVEQAEEIVGDDAFHGIAIVKFQEDPEAVELGAREEGFAHGLGIVGKFADEIDAADVGERERAMLAVGREQIERFRSAEIRRVQIALYGLAASEDYLSFLARSGRAGWGLAFHGVAAF
jgi:hypothetical protein